MIDTCPPRMRAFSIGEHWWLFASRNSYRRARHIIQLESLEPLRVRFPQKRRRGEYSQEPGPQVDRWSAEPTQRGRLLHALQGMLAERVPFSDRRRARMRGKHLRV